MSNENEKMVKWECIKCDYRFELPVDMQPADGFTCPECGNDNLGYINGFRIVPDKPVEKPQLHVSMLNTLSRCGIQFQRRYGYRFGVWDKEEILPPAVAMAIGTATHKSVETNLQSVIDTGEPISEEAACDAARDAFRFVHEKEGLLFAPEETLDVEKTIGAAVDQAVALARCHYRDRAPLITDLLAVEKRFVIELTDYPIDLSGQMDIVCQDAIEDTKTAAKSKGEAGAMSLQMAMYAMAYKIDKKLGNGRFPETVAVTELLKYKAGPQVRTFHAAPDEKWIQPLHNRIERFADVLDAVRSGKQVFTPAQPDDWQCTRRWCGFAETCPFWSGR